MIEVNPIHPKRMFDLAQGLIRRKYSDSDIELILSGNFKRALRPFGQLLQRSEHRRLNSAL